jgi:hypothetical protein
VSAHQITISNLSASALVHVRAKPVAKPFISLTLLTPLASKYPLSFRFNISVLEISEVLTVRNSRGGYCLLKDIPSSSSDVSCNYQTTTLYLVIYNKQ